MAMALCERLPAQQYTFNTLQTGGAFSTRPRVSSAQRVCRRAPSQMTLTRWVDNETPFFVPFFLFFFTVYNSASVSLLLAVLYPSSPGFLRASHLQRSTAASPALKPADCPPPPPTPPPPPSLLPASECLTPTANSPVSAKHR